MIFPKSFLSKKFLGVDIGTSAIKLVELSGWGEKRRLENYGEIKAEAISEKPFRAFQKNSFSLSIGEIGQAIKAIIREAKIKTRESIFSLPDFSSFFTNFELPPMTKEELPQAVIYEARQHVPLPLGEVTLDWEVIGGKVSDQKKERLKILLVAVPNEAIHQYQEIAKIAGLQLRFLEAEVFGLIRSLIPAEEERVISIVEIGAQTTTCSIIEKRTLKVSHSFDLSGNDLTQKVATSLSIDFKTAQRLKEKYGLRELPLPPPQAGSLWPVKNLKEILLPLIDLILKEVERISYNFYQSEGKEVQKFILAGASALLPGLREYFESYFKKETEIANPFVNIFYPLILKETLKQIGPSFAIAIGMALRGFE